MFGRGRGRGKPSPTDLSEPESSQPPAPGPTPDITTTSNGSIFGRTFSPANNLHNNSPLTVDTSGSKGGERQQGWGTSIRFSSDPRSSSSSPEPEQQTSPLNPGARPFVPGQSNSIFGKTTNVQPETPSPADSGGSNSERTAEDVVDEENAADSALLAKLVSTGLKWVDENNVTVTDQRKDRSNPLFGQVQSFGELNLRPEIIKALQDMNFVRPSAIQSKALPILLSDPPNHMIAQSQSGTGKTAAFVLATLSRIDIKERFPQAILLSPTYELAKQTGDVVIEMSKYLTGFTMRYAVRGERVSKGDVVSDHVIIGTPGTVMDWALRFRVFDITRIKVFVLDEADIMIDAQGHQDQSIRIHKALSKHLCQMMFFSATFSEQIMEFANRIVSDPVLIMLKREELSLDSIKQFYIRVENADEKLHYLFALYRGINIGAAIIFCHTRKFSEKVAAKMRQEGMSVALLNGDMEISSRVAVLKRFKEGRDTVLITTNVCARGIDIDRVNLVINFDLPINGEGKPDMETYLHRIGRTGRFGRKGIAINMVEPKYIDHIEAMVQHFQKPINRLCEHDIESLN